MDGFFKKVNQKVKLGRRTEPDRLPGYRYLEDGFLKKKKRPKIKFGCGSFPLQGR